MDTTTALTALINSTTDRVLNEWIAEAKAKGQDADDYISNQLDNMEATEPEVVAAVSQRYLERVMGTAA